ncbi:MAG: histidine kinase dimerization/phospho-acceptor domain-containing protein [Patescibacteria group bacterium]
MDILSEINYYSFALLLGGVVALVSGISVYLKSEKGEQYGVWLLLNISSAVWSFGYFIMILAKSDKIALWSNWMLHFGAIFIPVLYFLFIIFITDAYKKYRRYIYVGVIFLLFFLITNTTTFFVKGVLPKYVFNYAPDAGPLYPYFTAYFFFFIGLAIFILILKILRTEGQEALRLKYILWSSIAGFLGGGSVFFLTFNVDIPPYPLIAFSLYPLIIDYAILKHNLFSIKVILVELAVFLLNLFLFLNVLTFNSIDSFILNGSVFLATLIFSVLLLRTIYKDIRIRERVSELAKQMMVANDRLRYMEKQKTEFVSIASHQLRTPLTVIKGYVSMIREGTFGPLSESARDAMDKLHKSSEKMVELVEDLLTVSRLEQKRAVLRFEVTDVVRMMRNIIAGVEDEADHVGLKMSLVAPADMKFLSMIDEKKFIQAIKHILDNAIRYTNPPGFVRIVISKSTLPGMIRISISDTGMGMTEEKLRSLSEQLDFKASAVVARLKTIMPKTKHQPGEVLGQSEVKNAPTGDKTVGVGLYIAKEIISAHRGNIWAKSEGLNKGTTVIVEIPEVKN